MALRSRSLFLYGYTVNALNSSIDFRAVALETPRMATLRFGFYSLTSLLQEVVRALTAADSSHTYLATANRNVNGGLENRITISTSDGTHLELLFASGPRTASTSAGLLGFTVSDFTGALTYTGSMTTGTVLVTEEPAHAFLPIEMKKKVFGTVNVSSSGDKESIVFNIQNFWQCEFLREPEAKVKAQWSLLMTWLIQQKLVEFTLELSNPSVFYEGTLEGPSKGLEYNLPEMLPDFPFYYRTGSLMFRTRPQFSAFI